MPDTLLYVGIMALFSVLLANYVLYVRLRARSLPEWQPQAAERVQANFVENVPLALIVLYLLEVAGATPTLLHIAGGSLCLLRMLHAYGLARFSGANYPRLIGAQGTFLWLACTGMLAIFMWWQGQT